MAGYYEQRQSMRQALLDAIYQSMANLIVTALLVLALKIFVENTSTLLPLSVLAVSFFPLIAVLFNRACYYDSDYVHYGFKLDLTGIHITKAAKTETVLWHDYAGYTISNWVPRTISINCADGHRIQFSYNTFAESQRLQLLNALSARQPDMVKKLAG